MLQINKVTLEEREFQEARRQIMELCINAYEEGRNHQIDKSYPDVGFGQDPNFKDTKTFKIIMNLKTVSQQMEELLLKGNKS